MVASQFFLRITKNDPVAYQLCIAIFKAAFPSVELFNSTPAEYGACKDPDHRNPPRGPLKDYG